MRERNIRHYENKQNLHPVGLNVIHIQMFEWANDEHTVIDQETSTLEANGIFHNKHTIMLKSYVTGRVQQFDYHNTKMDTFDGEIYWWEYICIDPNFPIGIIRIYND